MGLFWVQIRVTRLDMTFLGDFMVKNRNFESFLAFLSILSQFFKFPDRGIFGTFFGPNACN